jgi:hypothetical protein
MDGKEGCLVIVDGKARGSFKELQDFFCGSNSVFGGAEEDQSVVCVLEDSARSTRDDRVRDIGCKRMKMQKAPENICNDDKKVGGEGVTLS